jgi:hypothetical protein
MPNAIGDFIDWLTPDQLDLAALLDRFGAGVRPAVYELLCDTKGKSRSAASRALKRSVAAGVEFLAPKLVKDFKLDAATATAVATLVVRTVATRGQGQLCAELAKTARPAKPRRRPRKPPTKQPARMRSTVKKRR